MIGYMILYSMIVGDSLSSSISSGTTFVQCRSVFNKDEINE